MQAKVQFHVFVLKLRQNNFVDDVHHSVRSRVVALLDARVVGVHDVIEATQHDGTVVGERA